MPETKCLAETQPMTAGREQMTACAESGVDRFEDGEKALRVFWRLETFHPPFSDPGWLMRVLSTIVEVATLSMLNVRQDLPLAAA